MEKGDIIGFESHGYMMSHRDRTLPRPVVSLAEAQANISQDFTVEEQTMAIVPTGGKNEVFCYEFLCVAADGQKVIVYIDANTGEEENMLILIENENGTLTM